MDEIIDKALWNHARITLRLRSAIFAPTAADEETVRSDRKCKFGVWLFGPGLQHCGSREYQRLKNIHKQLHEAAYDAFCHCRNGKPAIAELSVTSGDFKRLSDDMRTALLDMRAYVVNREATPRKLLVARARGLETT